MKISRIASTGSLPSAMKRMPPAIIVATIASTGVSAWISGDERGRGSRRSTGELRLCRGLKSAAHHPSERFKINLAGGARGRQPPAREHREGVGNLHQLIKVLADDDHPRTIGGEGAQGCADLRGGARIDAPGRLIDHQHL